MPPFLQVVEAGSKAIRTQKVLLFDLLLSVKMLLLIAQLSSGERGFGMGKRRIYSEKELKPRVLPKTTDVLGTAEKMLGNDRLMVKCQDGHTRLCRIRGKMKRRAWIRRGDIVLVSPWDFQFEQRGDIIWRYKRNQLEWLRTEGYLEI
jgi:translation initiation factor 1A